MQTESISVVIPCHNASRYLAATLKSVHAQAGYTLEVIVVDDGSTDGSAEVAEGFSSEVVVLRQTNQGAASARNAGIARATHEWIAFLDADDLWLPGKLHSQFEQLARHAGARMCYTAWDVWSSCEPSPDAAYLADLEACAKDESRWSGASGWIYRDLLIDSAVWTSTVLLHRSLLDEIGLFDPSLHLGEDLDLWLRASRTTPILRVCRPLALYRMHPASLTHIAPPRNYRAEVINRALERWGYDSPDGAKADPEAVRRKLAQSWFEYGDLLLGAGDVVRARTAAAKALRIDPAGVGGWKVYLKTLLRSLSSRINPAGQP